MEKIVPIEVSARHVHLSKKDLEALFGFGYKLKKMRNLSQPGFFAAKEVIGIERGNQKIADVRILGPLRKRTQIELSLTDVVNLGIKNPTRNPGITIIGPKGKMNIKKGAIVAWRHIHLGPEEARKLGLKNGGSVSIKTKGKRALIFNNVLVRIDKNFKKSVHLDTDEGNAAGITKKGKGTLVINSKCKNQNAGGPK
ncbi:MAG: propanediol utilization protein [Parcubacteria group bacterium CG11_big_fil_rev_8_21_14_0_20_39_14]|nr:MAG: propanediol utilization protein [Parcubacteria group bacterium CG11_big_fil_rev_8_21_14_0_20_39_14]PIS35216.1 MAG: propanediol utilization protein [Parcubacteria group bacterium CG08_land_8_20_14_0_20_38_56]